ncbi:MAG TPA: DUF2490 domain-containing protein [Flavobacteriales bacterium]
MKRGMMVRWLWAACASIALCNAHAQRVTDRNANLWVSHWGDHRLSPRWSVHTEGHWRRADMGAHWQQLLLRPAVNFHLNDHVMFTFGYSYYANHPYGDHPIRFANREHQLWQQVQLSQPIGRLRIAHRFRIEERWIAAMTPSADDPSTGTLDRYMYQNRFRYRVWLTLPLGHPDPAPGVFTANFYDEVFLNFGDSGRPDLLQQNRISALLGYQLSKPFTVLAGYLLQHIQRPGAASGADLMEANSTVHLALVYNLDLRKPTAL